MPFRVLSDHQCNSLASVSPWNGVFTVSKYFCRNFEAEGTVKGKVKMMQSLVKWLLFQMKFCRLEDEKRKKVPWDEL